MSDLASPPLTVEALQEKVAALETGFVHSTAHISDSTLGLGARVWQFASIIRNSRIGAYTSIGAYAIIDGSIIGEHCSIGSFASINPGSFLGSQVFIGPHVVLCNDPWPAVAKDDFVMEDLLAGSRITVHIQDLAAVGAGAIILPGVSIGIGSIVAAGAVVEQSVPERHLYKRSGEIVKLDERERRRYVRVTYRDNAVGRG